MFEKKMFEGVFRGGGVGVVNIEKIDIWKRLGIVTRPERSMPFN